jgi:hypothetical protein
MPAPRLLSDELVHDLIAVGQVDVLVGIPSLNHADCIATVVRAAHAGLDRSFVRERTVVINVDGGSTDGTADVVRGAGRGESETLSLPSGLRTRHRISAPYHGVPGKAGALRMLFAMADLLQARAVAVLDPEVTSIDPNWVTSLVRPVLRDGADFVAPAYARHPLDGPLVSQLIRPLVRAAYGVRLLEPVGGEFACSAGFAGRALAETPWDESRVRDAPDIWLTSLAITRDVHLGQAALGPRVVAPRDSRPALPVVLAQVMGAILFGLERHEAWWIARGASEPVPMFGDLAVVESEPPRLDADAMAAAFREGVSQLGPLLEDMLEPAVLAAIREAAGEAEPHLDDALWTSVVYQFIAAHHRRRMHGAHVLQALVPLYLGRAAGFVTCGTRDAAAVSARLEALALEFERARPELVRRWNPDPGR